MPRSRTRLRAVTRWGSIGLAVVMALSSCVFIPILNREDEPAIGTSRTPVGVPPGQEALTSFYTQSLDWQPCDGGECANLSVPADYADPTGTSISIALLRVASRSSQTLGSLVVNPGGPGGSGVDYAKAADFIVGAPVRRRYDIVGFDPRGVGRSAPIDCLSDQELDDFLGGDPTPETPAEQAAFIDGARTLAAGCARRSPDLLPHVSTQDAAKDLDILRSALDEPKLNYLGKSYGTFLGATYAGLFPTYVGRFVLDGVVPPDLTSTELSEGQARGFEAATRAYVQDCIDDGDCLLGDTVDEGMQWIRDFLARLDAAPIPVTSDGAVTELTEGWGSIGIAAAMYDQGAWRILTRALEAADRGVGDELMSLANQYADRNPGGSYAGNIMEVIYAVNCLDRDDSADLEVIAGNVTAFRTTAPTWGPFLAWGSVPCGVWKHDPAAPPTTITAEGSDPIVVVGTTRDPATIYEWSVQLNDQLANSSLVTFDGDGHTAYTRSNACVDDAIDEYFVSGTVPEDGLRC